MTNKCDLKNNYYFGMGRELFGNRRKCWLQVFSPFLNIFSEDSYLRVLKSQDHGVTLLKVQEKYRITDILTV